MATYTFYLHDGARTVPEFVIEELADTEAALAMGAKLLHDRPRYEVVEITKGDEEVGKLTRPKS